MTCHHCSGLRGLSCNPVLPRGCPTPSNARPTPSPLPAGLGAPCSCTPALLWSCSHPEPTDCVPRAIDATCAKALLLARPVLVCVVPLEPAPSWCSAKVTEGSRVKTQPLQ